MIIKNQVTISEMGEFSRHRLRGSDSSEIESIFEVLTI